MNICIIGAGYVGLVTGIGFALKGHRVIFVDVDSYKVEHINKGIPYIYEEGLEEAMRDVHRKGLIEGTSDYSYAVAHTDLAFVCVPTPTQEDGDLDLTFIKKACESIGKALSRTGKDYLVVIKSTVLPGTTESVVKNILASFVDTSQNIRIAVNPEFLREGKALYDVLYPDRIVIGVEDEKSKNILLNIYRDFADDERIIFMRIKEAELVKYASNAFLSMKISFANLVGRISKRLGIDVYRVMDAVGMDKRIGREFLNAGLGFGGSCFPKDVKALSHFTASLNVDNALWNVILDINEGQIDEMISLMERKLGTLKGAEIVVLGLSFKPGTDDVRESRALVLIRKLLEKGVKRVYAHDPIALKNAQNALADIKDKVSFVSDVSQCLEKADVVVIATEWDIYKDETLYRDKIVFDSRKTVTGKYAKYYEGLGW